MTYFSNSVTIIIIYVIGAREGAKQERIALDRGKLDPTTRQFTSAYFFDPSIPILSYNTVMFIGIDIGGSKVRVAASLNGLSVDHSVRFVTPANQRRALPLIIKAIENVVGQSAVDAIGIACPGPIDRGKGKILNPVNIAWRNLEICQPLKKRFNCPVILEHDATCGGLAEARRGSGRHKTTVLYVTISTGIGSSLIIDGQPSASAHNCEGGKIIIDPSYQHSHHMPGTFENIVSGSGIKRRFGKIAADIHNPHDWALISHDLAVGLFNLIVTTSPDTVVLAGGVAVHFKRFEKPLKRELKQLESLYQYQIPPVVQARFVETAPVLGAIMLASSKT